MFDSNQLRLNSDWRAIFLARATLFVRWQSTLIILGIVYSILASTAKLQVRVRVSMFFHFWDLILGNVYTLLNENGVQENEQANRTSAVLKRPVCFLTIRIRQCKCFVLSCESVRLGFWSDSSISLRLSLCRPHFVLSAIFSTTKRWLPEMNGHEWSFHIFSLANTFNQPNICHNSSSRQPSCGGLREELSVRECRRQWDNFKTWSNAYCSFSHLQFLLTEATNVHGHGLRVSDQGFGDLVWVWVWFKFQIHR